MKERHGFVGNSSSSSFLAYGIDINSLDSDTSNVEITSDDAEDVDLDWFGDGFVGLSWDTIDDDETGRAFKFKIQCRVNKLLRDKGLEPEYCYTTSGD